MWQIRANKYRTYRTIEAFSMISSTHGFEIFITGFDRKFTSGTLRLKHSSIIYRNKRDTKEDYWQGEITFRTVRLTFFDMKWIWTERFLTCRTEKTLRMPSFFHGMNAFLGEWNEKMMMNRIVKVTFKIFWVHLAQNGARYCSKSFSQYNLPFSSTKPHSCKLIEQFEQVKWSTQ